MCVRERERERESLLCVHGGPAIFGMMFFGVRIHLRVCKCVNVCICVLTRLITFINSFFIGLEIELCIAIGISEHEI